MKYTYLNKKTPEDFIKYIPLFLLIDSNIDSQRANFRRLNAEENRCWFSGPNLENSEH